MVVDFSGAKICQGCFCHKQHGFKVGVKKSMCSCLLFHSMQNCFILYIIISKRNTCNLSECVPFQLVLCGW